nr:SNF2-related domain containing protein [Haemonchus contortus]
MLVQGVVCATPPTPMDLGELRPTLSDSLASLTLDDGSPYGMLLILLPSLDEIAFTLKGPPQIGVDHLSEEMIHQVPQRVLPFSKPEKSTDVAKHVIELAEDEMVEESVVTTEQSPEPDDIIVLHESENIGRIAETEKKARSRNYADFDVITIESSSDEEKEDDDIVDLETSTEEKSHSQKDVKAIRTVSKFSHDTTGVLEDKLANLNDSMLFIAVIFTTVTFQRPKEVQEVVVVNDQEQQRPPFPIFNERRPPPPDIIEVVDPQPPLHRFKRDKALQELHKALISQPPAQQLTEAPEGLTVPLKEHQMSGLTWMKWRESLAPGGGILADEMGLGKTLSIIALIVDAKIARKERRRNGKDEQDRERKKRIREEG